MTSKKLSVTNYSLWATLAGPVTPIPCIGLLVVLVVSGLCDA